MLISTKKIRCIYKRVKKSTVDITFVNDKNGVIVKVCGPLGVLTKFINNIKIVDIEKDIISTTRKDMRSVIGIISKLITGVSRGWYFAFSIHGRGLSFKVYNNFDKNCYLRLKIGYSHIVLYKLSHDMLVKTSKRKFRLIVFGLDFWKVNNLAYCIRKIRSTHTYKIQGIKFLRENITVKPGKQKQA